MDILESDSTEPSSLVRNGDTLATDDEFFTLVTKTMSLDIELDKTYLTQNIEEFNNLDQNIIFAEPITHSKLPTAVDRIVSNPEVKYYFDPEYFVVNPDRILMTYQDAINRIWLTKIDPITGTPQGRGLFLGRTVPEVQGPEFGLDANGLAVYYTNLDKNGFEQVFKAPLDGNFIPEQLTFDLQDNTKVFPTQNPLEPEVRLSYYSRDEQGTTQFVAAKESSADQAVRIPINFGDGGNEPYQWVPGQPAILPSLIDQNGFYQVARFDVETGQTLILTKDPSNKADAKIYDATEFDTRLLYAVLQDTSEVAFYLFNEVTRVFDNLRTLTIPTDLGSPEELYLDSVEAFNIQERTYVVAAVGLQENTVGPRNAVIVEELWLISLDQEQDPVNLKINAEGIDGFFDPEVIIPDPNGNRALISYWTLGFPNDLHTVEVIFPK